MAERPHEATLAVTVNYDVRDELREGGEEISNTPGGNFTVVTVSPEVGYRFPHGLAARLRIPIHHKTFDESVPDVHVERTGLGDVELLGGYDVLQGRHWRLTASAGLALPTGEHEEQPFVGSIAPTPLQLGSGTLDPLLGLATRFALNRHASFDASVSARLAVLENMHEYRPASVVETALGTEWRPWPERLGLDVAVEWSHVTKVAVAGDEVPNTGRDTLYLVPGANVHIWRGLALGANVRVPIYLHVNERQFTEDFLVAVRVVYRTPPLLE